MSTQKQRKSRVRHRKNIFNPPRWYVIDNNGEVVTKISDWYPNNLEVSYDNTGGCSIIDTIPITTAEFIKDMKNLKKKYGVKFSIKTEWGTNDIHSS